DRSHAGTLRQWCAEVIAVDWKPRAGLRRAAAGWARGGPLSAAAYRSRPMLRELERLARRVEFHSVVGFSSTMAPLALAVPAKRRVLDLCDADSEKCMDYAARARFPMSRVWRAEGRRLRAFELECLRRFDATIVINERERRVIDPQGTCATL